MLLDGSWKDSVQFPKLNHEHLASAIPGTPNSFVDDRTPVILPTIRAPFCAYESTQAGENLMARGRAMTSRAPSTCPPQAPSTPATAAARTPTAITASSKSGEGHLHTSSVSDESQNDARSATPSGPKSGFQC